jgi:hypothetical protein
MRLIYEITSFWFSFSACQYCMQLFSWVLMTVFLLFPVVFVFMNMHMRNSHNYVDIFRKNIKLEIFFLVLVLNIIRSYNLPQPSAFTALFAHAAAHTFFLSYIKFIRVISVMVIGLIKYQWKYSLVRTEFTEHRWVVIFEKDKIWHKEMPERKM